MLSWLPLKWQGHYLQGSTSKLTSTVSTVVTKPSSPNLLHQCYLFLSTLLHADTSDCLFPLSPILSQRACVLLQFNLTVTISSYHLMPCTICIWCCDTILPIPMYDTHLRATHTTTSSTRGVQIPIYLVSSTTDSLWWSTVVFKL